MKRLLISGLLALLISAPIFAQELSAAQWAQQNEAVLCAATKTDVLADLLRKGKTAWEPLAVKILSAGKADPVASTQIAALGQYVLTHPVYRAAYSAWLLEKAQQAKEADVVCFWLNQLRWCGLPEQAAAMKSFAQSKDASIAAFALMVEQALRDSYDRQVVTVPETRAAALTRELAMLPEEAVAPRLVKFFEDADIGCVRAVLARGVTGGGAEATQLWMAAYARQTCPFRKKMILELLGDRGDRLSLPLLQDVFQKDLDLTLRAVAAEAMFKLDRSAVVSALMESLKTVAGSDVGAELRKVLIRLTRAELVGLTGTYDAATPIGKSLLLEIFRMRRVADALPLGLKAISETQMDVLINGWRLLRETATPSEAVVLTDKALSAKGRAASEAQQALAAAARRDGTGAYARELLKVVRSGDAARKALALELSPRMGGADLFKEAVAALDAPAAEISGAGARALSEWEGTDAVPVLMRAAIAGKTPRVQALALRGVSRKLADAKIANRFISVWKEIKALPGNDANRAALQKFFSVSVNVAQGKPVTTNVPTEGDHVPANLTDGTLTRAWHGGGSPAQAVVDLGKAEMISSMHVFFYCQDGRAYTFNLELSEDKKIWKKVAGNEGAAKPSTKDGVYETFAPTKARYARLNVLKNSANFAVHVLELKLFSAKAE